MREMDMESLKKASSSQSRDKTEGQRQKYEKIFRRIGRFKKYTHDLCSLISNHSVKIAGLRDKNDELAKCLDDFTKIEEFSTTSKLSMAVAAELVATVGDHQDLGVKRTETLVLPNLASYSRICDCIKADLWNAIQAIRREKRKRKVVTQLRKRGTDPKNKSLLSDAQRELERASAETARFCGLCEEQVLKFEHKRLMDLKESLGNFIKIQIATHAKSLELLSDTYKHVQSIDEDGDLEILKSCLKIGGTGGGDCKKEKESSKKKVTLKPVAVVGKKGSKNLKDTPKNCKRTPCASATSHSSTSGEEDELNSEPEVVRNEMISHLEKKLHHQNHDYHQRDKQLKNYEDLACRQNHSKRPSTPQRPITVAGGGGKNRGSNDDLSFKKGGRSAPAKMDAYYYSQSDDESRRHHHHHHHPKRIASPQRPEVPLTPKKHVTFYKDKPSIAHSPSAYQSSYKYNSNYANYSGANGSAGGDQPKAIRNYFQSGGSGGGLQGQTVKKYC